MQTNFDEIFSAFLVCVTLSATLVQLAEEIILNVTNLFFERVTLNLIGVQPHNDLWYDSPF